MGRRSKILHKRGLTISKKGSQDYVLKFQLDTEGHPLWIKTVKGIRKENGVSSGISGVGQGQTSGVLIWDTSDIMEGTYYYQCEFAPPMVGRIIVAAKKGSTLFKT